MFDHDLSRVPILVANIRKNATKHQLSVLEPYGLSKIHAMYLVALLKEEGLTLNELCERLGVTKANTSRAVTDLLEKGYIKKEYAKTSCFKYKVELTESGKTVAEAVEEDMKKVHTILLKEVTQEELTVIISVMDKISRAAEQLND